MIAGEAVAAHLTAQMEAQARDLGLTAGQLILLRAQERRQNYPAWLTTDTRRVLMGLRYPTLPAKGDSVTITDHWFHPSQTYTVAVNSFGDVTVSSSTRNLFGFSHASSYSISRNPEGQ